MADIELLREYVQRNSEEAFATLVKRHVNMVYSAALRKTGSPDAAGEIAQVVFIILARKAADLRRETVLAGWLYQTTRLTSANFLRTEIRRARREQEAFMQSLPNENASETWSQIMPLLEDAMGRLGEKERNAIALRFFEGRNFKEVGNSLGTGEDAAKMRVSRALEKLRKFFAKRGVNSTTAIIAGVMTAHSLQAAPASLAATITTVAVAKGAAASSSTLTLVKGALKLMAWSKTKIAIVAGAVALLAAGTTTITYHKIQAHKTYAWELPQASFGVFYKMPAQVVIVPAKFSTNGDWVCDGSRGTLGIAQPVDEIIRVAYQKDKLRTVITKPMPPGLFDFIAKVTDGTKMPGGNAEWAPALQKEITRKFGITGNIETRETDVLVLRPVGTGVRGLKVSHHMPKGLAMRPTPGDYAFFEQPVSTLKSLLEHRFKIPIVDRTGLTEQYDYTLKWNEPDPKQPNVEGLKQALHDQLGLELAPSREPIEMLVVE